MPAAGFNKFKILIVDDSEFNREFLTDILSDSYDIVQAEDGAQAISLMENDIHTYALVLLDVVMPRADGFSVLAHMNRKHWIDDVPVIMITSETASDTIRKAYEYGATDYINRPFDVDIVRQCVSNTILLYAKQRKLAALVAQKVYENEKNSDIMVSVLSHIVEFRNGESGPHVHSIRLITGMLLRRLIKKTDRYNIDARDIPMICNAAALHDAGKITIAEDILNKPGQLTEAERRIIQSHAIAGAEMLKNLPIHKNELLIRTSYDICRWHHERWDGSGYPDGLAGDAIPISAQVVALADVYDALTNKRCYKPAYTHKKALEMIFSGQCGAFNPLLLECLEDISGELLNALEQFRGNPQYQEDFVLRSEIESYEELNATSAILENLEVERKKTAFLADQLDDPAFSYRCEAPMLAVSPGGAKWLGSSESLIDPLHSGEINKWISREDLGRVVAAARSATADDPDFDVLVTLNVAGNALPCLLRCQNIWLSDPLRRYGLIGRIIRLKGV